VATQNKLTAARVEEKLRELHGNYAAVARAFGVTRQAVQGFIGRHPTLQAEADHLAQPVAVMREQRSQGRRVPGLGPPQ
jgi:hypothetical protein